jgi:uncharacterized membrane protein
MSSVSPTTPPLFNAPIRWTLRALAWTAFATSAYLAWHAVNQTPIAGCGDVGQSGCAGVTSSSWSKWLGLPVAIAGLGCYATLAGLSVLLGNNHPRTSRWINTLFIMLAVAAAAASIWFLALQVVVIGEFCRYCIVTDIAGIALGAIALGATLRWLNATRHIRRAPTAAGLMALRSALPTPGARSVGATAGQRELPAPSLPVALSGAFAIVLLLIGGQILFPAKTYDVQQVALSETIEMDGGEDTSEPRTFEPESHNALRPIDEAAGDQEANAPNNGSDSDVRAAGYNESADSDTLRNSTKSDASAEPPSLFEDEPESTEPAPPATANSGSRSGERIVKFLDGKLSFDVYKHPLIGSPEAPHVVVEMVSYNCKHCRAMHSLMKKAQSRYGNQVAILVMIVPMERSCNPFVTSSNIGACATARMVLGVARLKPAAFPQFHDWLMADKDDPPARDRIIARAYSLADSRRLRELSDNDELNKQIESYVNLFGTLRKQYGHQKNFGLPVQILGDHVFTGSVEKPEELYRAWEEYLGVTPR